MKFKILCKNDNGEWWEPYDKPINDPDKWAEETVQKFNDTLRPHELPRTLLKVEVIDESNSNHHSWIKRTDGMSVEFRGRLVDLMYCEKCGITGKRSGFSGFVKIDSKFKSKKYIDCDTAKEQRRKDAKTIFETEHQANPDRRPIARKRRLSERRGRGQNEQTPTVHRRSDRFDWMGGMGK